MLLCYILALFSDAFTPIAPDHIIRCDSIIISLTLWELTDSGVVVGAGLGGAGGGELGFHIQIEDMQLL